MELKLNMKRTFLVGFAFFAILALWRVYYFYCPLYLENFFVSRYGAGDYNYLIGIIMAIDNLFALFMIPLCGWFSDKTKTRLGRRMPYIIAGTAAAVILFPLMAVMYLIDSLVWFCVLMVLLVLSMCLYRSPAVSLMPDITPKPLRSKANAIINFMGYVGAIIASGFTLVFTMKNETLTVVPFILTSVMMAAALVLLCLRFKENKVVAEVRPELEEGEKLSETIEKVEDDKPLSKRDRINFFLLISAVFLCYFAFNALDTFGSLYGEKVLDTASWGLVPIVLAVSSLITFLPSIRLTAKVGRKNSLIIGLGLLIVPLAVCACFAKSFAVILVMFAVSGAGWAILNVNTYPMLVEMASRKNVGRITGIYYIASQAAQALTSVAVGFVFDWLGLEFYFVYAIIFMSMALALCLVYKVKKPSAAEKA